MSSRTTRDRRNLPALRLAGLALVAGISLAGAGGVWASPAGVQGLKSGEQPCVGDVSGYLGIGLGDCRGCTLTLTQESKGWKKAWSFATEPRIGEIAPDSPAARALQVGDEIVGIDGVLITSTDGGRRFASIEPDQSVTIRYRRRGQPADVVVRAGRRCGPFVEGMRMKGPFARLTEASLLDDVLSRLAPGIRVRLSRFPHIRFQGDATRGGTTMSLAAGDVDVIVSPRDPVTGRREVFVAEGRLGLRWSCQPSCSATDKDGHRVWRFKGPLRVTGIETGGPADLAGVRMGDQLTAVDGHTIESAKGGQAFSDVRPGQPMLLTLRGPDGRERTVSVVPQAPKPDDVPE